MKQFLLLCAFAIPMVSFAQSGQEIGPDVYVGKDERLDIDPTSVVAASDVIRFEVEGDLSIVSGSTDSGRATFSTLDGFVPRVDFVVKGGSVRVSGVDFPSGFEMKSEGGAGFIDSVTASEPLIVLGSQASVDVRNSRLSSSRGVVLTGGSSLSFASTSLSGSYLVLSGTSTASVMTSELESLSEVRSASGSVFSMTNSFVADAPMFFAVDGGRIEVAGSRMVKGAGGSRHLFQATRGASITVDRSNLDSKGFGVALVTASSSMSVMDTYAGAAPAGVEAYDRSLVVIASSSIQGPLKLGGSSVVVTESRLFDAPDHGIYLANFRSLTPSLKISGSTIEGFGVSGIYAITGSVEATGVALRGGKRGVDVVFASTTIASSSFSGHAEWGAVAQASSTEMRAIGNYWGDPSGPFNAARNASGTGAAVSDRILFEPWLSSDPTGRCCSSVLFIPGFQASRLFLASDPLIGDDLRAWEPDLFAPQLMSRLAFDESGGAVEPGAYVGSVLDEALVPVLGKNYYKSLFSDFADLKEEGSVADWAAVPYDWRLSVDDVVSRGERVSGGISYAATSSTPFIKGELVRLAAGSKTGKVTIVAHSNGGLVAKALLLDRTLAEKVDKLILVASPQVGTPHAIGALLHGFDQRVIPFLIAARQMAELGRTWPGAYGLLPSDSYHSIVSSPVAEFVGELAGRMPIASVDGVGSIATGVLSGVLANRARELHLAIDAWRPAAGVRVVEIAGWGIDTVSGIRYSKLGTRPAYRPVLTEDGDGTVVAPSALALPASSQVTRYWINLARSNGDAWFNRRHAQILESKPARALVRREITGGDGTIEWVSASAPAPMSDDKMLRYFLYGEDVSIDLYDAAGNHTGLIEGTGEIEEAVPGSRYAEFGEVRLVSVPLSSVRESNRVSPPPPGRSSVRVEISSARPSPDQSFGLEVEEAVPASSTESVRFPDVALSASTTAHIDVDDGATASSGPPLIVDHDGDGEAEKVIAPGEVATQNEDEGVAETLEEAPRPGSSHREVAEPAEIILRTDPKPSVPVFAELEPESQENEPLAAKPASVDPLYNVQSQVASVGMVELPGQLLRNEHTPMKKVLWIIVFLALVGAGAYAYVTRPTSAPTLDVEGAAGKLPAGSATSSVYRIQPSKSLVKFTMNELLSGKPFLVVGTTTEVAGQVSVDASGVRFGSLAVNAKTFVTDNPRRDSAINRLILKTEGNPENELITFVPNAGYSGAVAPGQPVTFDLAGDLTISGVTKPATFKVTMTVADGQVTGTASTTIRRSDFGLVIPNIPFVANVDDEFPVTVEVVADRIML